MLCRMERQLSLMEIQDLIIMQHFSIDNSLFREQSHKISKMSCRNILQIESKSTIIGAILMRCLLAFYIINDKLQKYYKKINKNINLFICSLYIIEILEIQIFYDSQEYILKIILNINYNINKIHNKKIMSAQTTRTQRVAFAILLAILEIIVAIFYGIFMKVQPTNDQELNTNYYPMYQDVNVMMLIGFGFLMAFIKGYTWSALSYTFLLNAVVVQIYILWSRLWHTVFHSDGFHYSFTVNQKSFTAASYCSASMLIAFGAVLGKVGPLELLVMVIVGVFGYTLNEDLMYNQLKIFDAGGSTAIHCFGAFYGLVVSFFISRSKQGRHIKNIQTSRFNNTFAMIGTLFLWMFWPSFNAGYFPSTPFEKSLIIGNTVIALTASCLGAFIATTYLRQKICMEDIINATLAGGVIIGAPSSLITHPGGAFAIGLGAGCISTFCFYKLAKSFQKFFHIHDTCGVHNLHGIPGFLGGILSAVIIAGYNTTGISGQYGPYLPYSAENNIYKRTFTQQAGVQVAGTFASVGIGVMTGIIAGIILKCIYRSKSQEYFEDRHHFEVPGQQHLMKQHQITQEQILPK